MEVVAKQKTNVMITNVFVKGDASMHYSDTALKPSASCRLVCNGDITGRRAGEKRLSAAVAINGWQRVGAASLRNGVLL